MLAHIPIRRLSVEKAVARIFASNSHDVPGTGNVHVGVAISSLPTGEPGCFWKKPREFTREKLIVILPNHLGQHNSKNLKIQKI